MYKYFVQEGTKPGMLAKDKQEAMKALSEITGPLAPFSKGQALKFLESKEPLKQYLIFDNAAYDKQVYIFGVAGAVS